MPPATVLVLYPLWAVALAIGLVALRLGRETRAGLVLLSFALALWVSGLVMLTAGAPWAERVVPAGILVGGALVHAGQDVAGVRDRRVLAAAYGYCALAGGLGVVAPRLLYGPMARGAGPLFVPVALASCVGTLLALLYLVGLARAATDREQRRRRAAVALACAAGAPGGGGVVALRVLGWGDVEVAAPFLLVAVVLAGYAVFSGEHGRARDLLMQGAVQTVITAVLSAIGLTLFYVALPSLTPGRGEALGWVVVVVFLAALPLEPLRMLLVERVGRSLFRRPTTVPELTREVEASEVRADQAERLAELGRVVSAVAHEIRNPLGVVAAQVKLLERRGADPESLDAVRAQVDRAKRFLDDLLRYGKPRALEARAFDVGTALRLAVSNARQAFGAEAPEVVVEADEDLRLEADPSAFGDVATNLVQNALIATGAVGAGAPVRVTARAEQGTIVVVVADRGPGVPRELEATLFAPFVTGRGRDAKHPGTGLGLAIAARWLERHGGTLAHERVEGGGARFVARWPTRPR